DQVRNCYQSPDCANARPHRAADAARHRRRGDRMRRHCFIGGLVAVGLCLVLGTSASAQDYPARPIRIIIPLGPGGGGDVVTRAPGDELQKALGQRVVVENRPGGGQNIGARACAEAPPDGYTLCVLSSEPVVYNQFLFKSIPYDPVKDFEPIGALFVNTL